MFLAFGNRIAPSSLESPRSYGRETTRLLGGKRPNSTARPLTALERKIVSSVARGYSDRDIAQELVLSEEGVKRRLVDLLGKLNVSNRFELVIHALGHGLLQQRVNQSRNHGSEHL